MYKFGIIGAAGFIAQRNLKAIKDTGNEVVLACDLSDSVGILDSYSFNVNFTKDEDLFFQRVSEEMIDYVSICTPNHKHFDHAVRAMRAGANVICEKPLVLTGKELDELAKVEKETGKRVNTILQLRVHPSLLELKRYIYERSDNEIFEVDLSYITSRGNWFFESWKGDVEQSGGLPTNIGIHFFDMLSWIFGNVKESEVHVADSRVYSGYLSLERANVKWFLSVNREYLPQAAVNLGKTTYRSIAVNNREVEFSDGFTDLHTVVYRSILDQNGFGIEDARNSIELVEGLRNPKLAVSPVNLHRLMREIKELE